jgi:hypothetical protein
MRKDGSGSLAAPPWLNATRKWADLPAESSRRAANQAAHPKIEAIAENAQEIVAVIAVETGAATEALRAEIVANGAAVEIAADAAIFADLAVPEIEAAETVARPQSAVRAESADARFPVQAESF